MDSLTPFSKNQLKTVAVLLLILMFLTGFNLRISIRRGRDNQRKNDLSTLQKALDIYQNKHGHFPASMNGKIAACKGPVFIPCEWGKDKFENISTLPRDPSSSSSGREYLYFSNIKGYALYISLEGSDEPEYSPMIIQKSLHCGTQVCNYGREYNY